MLLAIYNATLYPFLADMVIFGLRVLVDRRESYAWLLHLLRSKGEHPFLSPLLHGLFCFFCFLS